MPGIERRRTGRPVTADFFRTLRETAVPNMRKLQAACRQARIEVMYTVIEALTKDGRDQSLDYKISRLFVPRGIVGRAGAGGHPPKR